MITRRELESAIRECESKPSSYQGCEKLATLYTVYDHLYGETEPKVSRAEESVIGEYGSSEFLSLVAGRSAEAVWKVMDELMDALQITNPRLYDGVIRKIAE